MKVKYLFMIALCYFTSNFAQTDPLCGSALNETFDTAGALPADWIEYNTSGRVIVEVGKLKFNHNTSQPSAYRTFSPVATNASFSFDVLASRAAVNCQVHLIASTGKYLSSVGFGLGSAAIKYATTMVNGMPSGFKESTPKISFPSNTNFTISTKIDFVSKTVDFYVNGELMAANIPFLENAEDAAKIDIQLIYMYANSGQFYFDNMFVLSGDENRILLTNKVTTAETELSTATIGDSYNQIPQSAADAFQIVIDSAKAILADCAATSAAIDASLAELETAQDVFNNSRVNDPVLKMYANYNFTGEEREVFCGYYNGNLGAYDDFGVSFTLDQGYMATFAENIDGTGASKVYVAAENDLRINLPENLQNKISFIRVGPWFNVHKKGMAGKGRDVIVEYKNSWHYNWSTTGEDVGDAKFVPNQWSGGTLANAQGLGNRMDIAHYMAFNEPDGASQANMTVDVAIERYRNMLASGLRLGSPANKDNASGGVWRDAFMTKAEAEGLRVDFMVVHYYKKTTPASFYNWLKAIHDKWQRPIWIKEFNYGATWTGQPASNEAAGIGLISYMNMLDNTDFVERYSVFTWQPNNPIYSLMATRTPVTLSSSGIMYRDHESPIAYKQEVYEQGNAPLSVDDNDISSQVSVFPTIVKDGVLNIVYSNVIKSSKIKLSIYNMTGQLIKQVLNSNEIINIGNLSSGFYIVKIESGSNSLAKKFIVQ